MDEQKLSVPGKAILDASRGSMAASFSRGVVGAAIGGAIGWVVFGQLLSHGMYALALPGALLGLGFGLLARRSTIVGGLFCAVAALILMLLCEWHHRPWMNDGSLEYFMTHLHKLKPYTLVFLTLGTVFSFWFGRGR